MQDDQIQKAPAFPFSLDAGIRMLCLFRLREASGILSENKMLMEGISSSRRR